MLHLSPTQCYLGGEAKDRFHSRLFDFVDFGGAANTFLIACGSRHEPSVEEIAKKLLADPREFYKLAQGPSQFVLHLSFFLAEFVIFSPSATSPSSVT